MMGLHLTCMDAIYRYLCMYVRMCITMTVCDIEFIYYHMSVTGQTNMDSHTSFLL